MGTGPATLSGLGNVYANNGMISIPASGGTASTPFNATASVALGSSNIAVKAAASTLVVAALVIVGFYYWTRNHQL